MQKVWADYAAFYASAPDGPGDEVYIRPVPPYREYIAWLQRQDTGAV